MKKMGDECVYLLRANVSCFPFVRSWSFKWGSGGVIIYIIGSSSEHLNLCSLCLSAIELLFPCLGGDTIVVVFS
jgi:hypothetical protein